MSRIILTTIGSKGDLHPQIAIGLSLRERGHDVVFASHKEYRTNIESLGFEFHPIRPDNIALNNAREMARLMDAQKGSENTIDWVFGSLRQTYTDLISVAKDADFIIAGEGVVAARLVAEKLGISWALVVLSPISFFSAYDLPVLGLFPWLGKLRSFGPLISRRAIALIKFLTRTMSQPVHEFRRELGLPSLKNPLFDDKFSPYLNLALFSSLLGAPQPDWPANTTVTGFTFYDGTQDNTELSPELQHFLSAGDPPIVFTLGSAAVLNPGNFYQESIQIAKLLNRRAVLLIGKNPPPENLSEDIMAVNYLPHSQIFSHACAIVHQGGIGTTAQALRSGRPTLIMPYSHDQPDNAARVERLGTSRTIPRQRYNSKYVVPVLQDLLDNPSYAEKAAALGRILQAEDGVGVACNGIERHLSS